MKRKKLSALILTSAMILNCTAFSGFGVQAAGSGKKSPDAKPSVKVIDEYNFDDCIGTEIGGGIFTEGDVKCLTGESDGAGRYLRYKKPDEKGRLGTKIFGTAAGGMIQVDFQLAVFDTASKFTMSMYPAARGDYIMNTLSLSEGRLSASTGGSPQQIAGLDKGKWYNITMYYDFDNHSYSVAIDGKVVKQDLVLTMITGTIQSYEIDVPEGAVCDFGFDNLRVSYYAESEKPTGAAAVIHDSNTLYKHDFEGSAGNIATGSAGSVYYVTEGNNTFIRAKRDQKTGTCSSNYSFTKTSGDVSINFDFRLGDLSDSTKVFYLQSPDSAFHVPLYFDGTKVMLNMSDSDRPMVYDGLTKDKWYSMSIETDLANQTFSLSLDGKPIGEESYAMTNRMASEFNNVRIAVTWGDAGQFDVDNLTVKKINDSVDVSNNEIPGYDPNNDAPELNEWAKESYSEPTGEVYEAEDMQLSGYEAISDPVFHNGSGVKAGEEGFGCATFTYSGESGFKGINIAYSEEDGKYDSRYYLYQNGELIDWWMGQHDQKALYVRESKDYIYVNNGDEFMIRGSYGLDPSAIDYIEFTKGTKREFTFGELVAEERLHPTYWLSTSWDAKEDAGWVRNSLTVRDVKSNASNELIRRITPISCDFTTEFALNEFESSDFDFVIGDKNGYPVKVTFEGGTIKAGSKTFAGIIKEKRNCYIRVAVSPKNKTYSLMADGKLLASGIPFECDIEEFDIIKFITSKSGKAYFSAYPFLASGGYIVNENFRVYPDNGTPLIDWTADGRTRCYTSSGQRSDAFSREILCDSSIAKSFEPQSGTTTFETMILFPAKKDGARLEIGNSAGKIALYSNNGNICYDNGMGGSGIVWENYRSNVWYQAKIVIDSANHRADFAINDFGSTGYIDINPSAASLDYISVYSGPVNGSIIVDDIQVFAGTYYDGNDVPEINKPKTGDYNVVMLTCDMWREGHHFGNDSLYPFDNRTLFLGYQSEGDPEVCDWETKWMVEHGITVFAPCWYMPADGKSAPKFPRNGARLNMGFMRSKFQNDIQFALNLTYSAVSDGKENFLRNMVPYWIERYFRHPSYWKIDGKPVLLNYNTSEYNDAFGKEGTAEVIEEINQMCIDAGFEGVVFIGKAGVSDEQGYDYSYKYGLGGTDSGLAAVMGAATSDNAGNVPYIYSMSQGWGEEAWGRQARKLNVPLNEWKAALEYGKNVYMPSHNENGSLCGNTIILDNWNEYCEGHFLAPSKISGFGYLDMIREVFTDSDKEHTDLIPEEKFDQMSAQLW